MSRFTRIALAVGASALAALAVASRYYSITFENISADADDDLEGVVGTYKVARHDSHRAPREEVLARIQARVHEFEVLPPSEKTRFQSGECVGQLEGWEELVDVEFFFMETDPFALGVKVENEQAVGFFVIGREAVLDALAGVETSYGAVVATRGEEDDDFIFHVQNKQGSYRQLLVPASMIETFLAATNALVPIGGEPMDWDRASEHLGLHPSQLEDDGFPDRPEGSE